jgi:hypothetical protein
VRVDGGAKLDEKLDDFEMAIFRRHVNGSEFIPVRLVVVGFEVANVHVLGIGSKVLSNQSNFPGRNCGEQFGVQHLTRTLEG